MGRFIKTFAAMAVALCGLATPTLAQTPARSPVATAGKDDGSRAQRSPVATAGKGDGSHEQRVWLEKSFPRLKKADYQIIGPATPRYNCAAWALGTTNEWVWPAAGSSIEDFDRLITAFSKKIVVGNERKFNHFQRLDTLDYRVEEGKEKIVVYGTQQKGTWVATHVAKQMPDGTWTSKPGEGVLFRHQQPDDLNCDDYGEPIAVYVRATK